MTRPNIKKILIIVAGLIILIAALTGGAIADRLFSIKPLDVLFGASGRITNLGREQKILSEESVVIDVTQKVSPSVVTVSIQQPQRKVLSFSPFGGFESQTQGGTPEDIGSGFVVSKDGLIVTNKHVVADTTGTYQVITKDGKEYKVDKISRDPSNDIAILKITPAVGAPLTPIEIGDSSNLKVGQLAIAIGTALGEFRHTVTTGVVSGLGRGISAGSPLEGYVERLDNVIQTDAAINPGNSGGPLLNSAGQVIGINVAVAQGAQNIGFAIPINTVKDALKQFETTGKFPSKAFLGVEYQMIPQQTAIMNNVPQGAYVTNIVPASPADKAGVQIQDIITKIDNNDIKDTNGGLASIVTQKSPGDKVNLQIWRNGDTINITASLSEAAQ
ncbi:MAG TPA: trypsin-like peptidase domain-containing protein [Patescibacteria group bacterium]